MALSTAKIILANAATNTAGAYFEPVTVYTGTTTASTSAVNANGAVPAGIWTLPPSPNVVVQMNTSNNLSTPAYVNVATNVASLFLSDGVNVQVMPLNTANITVTLYGVNGGNAVSGTYNAS